MKKSLLAVSAILSTISIANAEDKFFFKPNVGLDLGLTQANMTKSFNDTLADQFNTIGLSAGARIHKNFGFEVDYNKSSEEDKITNTTQSQTKFSSIGIDGIYYSPLTTNLEAFTSAGVGRYDFKVKGPGGSASSDDIAPRIGGGVSYNINEKISFQASARHSFIKIKDTNGDVDGLNEIKVGLRYSF